MATPPKLPPKLREGHSDTREATRLINAMRDQIVAGNIGGNTVVSGQFSTPFSDDILGSSLGTAEVVGQVETPSVLASFQVQYGATAESAGGSGQIQIVIGGGDFTPDGTVLATIPVTSATPGRVEFPATGVDPVTYDNSAGDTRIKLVLTAAVAGQYLKVWDGTLVLV